MKGIVFSIQKFCTQDGPGIRTTVFLKGCPLRCTWCHNPESQRLEKELLFDADKCGGCRICAGVCDAQVHAFPDFHTVDRAKCLCCRKCEAACPVNAVEIAGREMTLDAVMQEVCKDEIFYKHSGGGMTLSGGEPLLQFEFAYLLLRQVKEKGMHTCIETSGYVRTENIRMIAEVTDLFLYDWKLTEDALHKKYTGVSNRLIRRNIEAIDSVGGKMILRCPVIPGINDTDQHFRGIAELANSHKCIIGIELEPYHPLGNSKHAKLGNAAGIPHFKVPDAQQIDAWLLEIQKYTQTQVIRA